MISNNDRMKKKLVVLNLFIVQVALLSFYSCDMFTTKNKKETVAQTPGDQATPKSESLTYELTSFKKRSKICEQGGRQCAEVVVQYPYFQQSRVSFVNKVIQSKVKKALHETVFNNEVPNVSIEKMADLIVDDYESFIDEFKDTSEKWDINVSVLSTFQKNQLLSLSFSTESYTGGAHPNSRIEYLIIDLNSEKKLRIDDLVSSKRQLTAVAERLFRKQKNLTSGQSLQDEGYFFEGGKFKISDNIGLQQNGLIIYFNSYEIAPYAMGPSAVIVPFYEIKDILKIGY